MAAAAAAAAAVAVVAVAAAAGAAAVVNRDYQPATARAVAPSQGLPPGLELHVAPS